MRYPKVGEWLAEARKRPSYKAAVEDYIPTGSAEKSRAAGMKAWPAIEKRLS